MSAGPRPPQAAGLQPGDRLVSVDGAAGRLLRRTGVHRRGAPPASTVAVVVERDGQQLTRRHHPRVPAHRAPGLLSIPPLKADDRILTVERSAGRPPTPTSPGRWPRRRARSRSPSSGAAARYQTEVQARSSCPPTGPRASSVSARDTDVDHRPGGAARRRRRRRLRRFGDMITGSVGGAGPPLLAVGLSSLAGQVVNSTDGEHRRAALARPGGARCPSTGPDPPPSPPSSSANARTGRHVRPRHRPPRARAGQGARRAAAILQLLAMVNIFLGAAQPDPAAALRRGPRGGRLLRGRSARRSRPPRVPGRHGQAHAGHLRRRASCSRASGLASIYLDVVNPITLNP